MKTLIIIPARFDSSRYPGKPLVKINNKELVLWVFDKCKELKNKNTDVLIATDDKKIANLAKKRKADVYINVQGDEPLIKSIDIKKVISTKKKFPNKVICGYSRLNENENPNNINIPKVVLNNKKELIYISRSAIPASKKKSEKIIFFKQVCIYAFNKKELKKFHSTKKSKIEKIEDIEILRFLEKDEKIQMVELSPATYAVDTPSDLIRIKKILKKNTKN
jgi:3-deoxy-manno-octulosonate cytidylyltransferase (CMP-KDO synthetase)